MLFFLTNSFNANKKLSITVDLRRFDKNSLCFGIKSTTPSKISLKSLIFKMNFPLSSDFKCDMNI